MQNILQTLNFNQDKNLQFFFAKLVHFVSLCQRLSKKLTSGSGSKQRFSLLQEKAVIQAVCLRTQAVSIKARF